MKVQYISKFLTDGLIPGKTYEVIQDFRKINDCVIVFNTYGKRTPIHKNDFIIINETKGE